MYRSLLFVAALAIVAESVYGQRTANTYTGMTSACKDSYKNRIETLYANDAACKTAVFNALNGTVKAQCADTGVGSQVHKCMTGNGNEVSPSGYIKIRLSAGCIINGEDNELILLLSFPMQTVINTWVAWIRGCEVMYIPNVSKVWMGIFRLGVCYGVVVLPAVPLVYQ